MFRSCDAGQNPDCKFNVFLKTMQKEQFKFLPASVFQLSSCLLLALVFCCSCTSPLKERSSVDEKLIEELVARDRISALDVKGREESNEVIFLAFSPPLQKKLIEEIANPSVLPLKRARYGGKRPVTDRMTGKYGMILIINDVQMQPNENFLSEYGLTKAQVDAYTSITMHSSPTGSYILIYFLKKENGVWKIIKRAEGPVS